MKASTFDQKFDDGEDITPDLELSRAQRPGLEPRRVNAVRVLVLALKAVIRRRSVHFRPFIEPIRSIEDTERELRHRLRLSLNGRYERARSDGISSVAMRSNVASGGGLPGR